MVWFAHEKMRAPQAKLVRLLHHCIDNKKSVLVHAPTGLGKTAAVLAPALKWAYENKGWVLFLTSRHTQHEIVLDTVKQVKSKFGKEIVAVSLMSKKFLCAHDNADNVHRSDFLEWCKSLRERDMCSFFSKSKSSDPSRIVLLNSLEDRSPLAVPDVVSECKKTGVCPYETALQMCRSAHIVVGDYNYFFNSHVRNTFARKTERSFDKCILVVDEAHNLPERIREMMSRSLGQRVLSLALKEAKRFELDEAEEIVLSLQSVFSKFESLPDDGELLISPAVVLDRLKDLGNVAELMETLYVSAERVLQDEDRSVLLAVARFLELWDDPQPYARMVCRHDSLFLRQRCLDPGIVSSELWGLTHSNILMSGTLTPVEMFRDVLGLEDAATAQFPSPFKRKNRLTLVVPRTTTQYRSRSPEMFKQIAKALAEIASSVTGCVAVFFPSYDLLNQVKPYFAEFYSNTIIAERQGMSVEEKQAAVSRLRSCVLSGAALLGVAAGSFGEGVDLPGVLNAVIVTGLPLERPNLEIEERIRHYSQKFGKKGRDYAYTLPALSRCFQNAGRCIRRENDKGALIFLDERFAWPMYRGFFPADWDLVIDSDYTSRLQEFFGKDSVS